jgi:enoyl-CoA hydratase/carnithine racemase
MGRGRALEILLGSQDVSADTAERYGYINRALPDDELKRFVDELAHRIAGFPIHTLGHIKRAVDRGTYGELSEGLLVEAYEADLCVANPVTQARVELAIQSGFETYAQELDIAKLISRLPPAQ